jgi:predicted transposase
MGVKTITCKLRTDEKASVILADTMRLFSMVCNHLSQIVWQQKIFRQFDLHEKAYHAVRGLFPDLPSQLVVRAIRVVTDSYKRDRSVKHVFGQRSAVVFDARCFKLKGVSSAILTTTQGRLTLSLAHGGKQRKMLEEGKVGEADLLFRDGNYYLAISITLPDPPTKEVTGVLGVDLGLSQIATDSEGEAFTGEPVKALRRKCRRLRCLLQRKGTRNAKRHLQKIRRKQRHFVATLNHQIAKRIVRKATSSRKAICLETLTGIRDRGNGF